MENIMKTLRKDKTEGEHIDWNSIEADVIYGYTWESNEEEIINSYTVIRTTQFDYQDCVDPDTFVSEDVYCQLYVMTMTDIEDGYITVRELWIPYQEKVTSSVDDFIGGMHQDEEDQIEAWVEELNSISTSIDTLIETDKLEQNKKKFDHAGKIF